MATNKQHPNRVELYLDDPLYDWLRRKAFAENRKMTEVVRELLQAQKDEEEQEMVTSEKTYKDCIVKRERVTSCGADWKERMGAGPAGEDRFIVSVVRKHTNPDFDEVLLPSDPLFQEAVEATK